MSLFNKINQTTDKIYFDAIEKYTNDREKIIKKVSTELRKAGIQKSKKTIRQRVDRLRKRYFETGSFDYRYKGGVHTVITKEAIDIGIKYYSTDIDPNISQQQLDIGLANILNIRYQSQTWYNYQTKLTPHIAVLEESPTPQVIQHLSNDVDIEHDYISEHDADATR